MEGARRDIKAKPSTCAIASWMIEAGSRTCKGTQACSNLTLTTPCRIHAREIWCASRAGAATASTTCDLSPSHGLDLASSCSNVPCSRNMVFPAVFRALRYNFFVHCFDAGRRSSAGAGAENGATSEASITWACACEASQQGEGRRSRTMPSSDPGCSPFTRPRAQAYDPDEQNFARQHSCQPDFSIRLADNEPPARAPHGSRMHHADGLAMRTRQMSSNGHRNTMHDFENCCLLLTPFDHHDRS